MVYRMIFNQTAYFGRGAIKEIPAVAKQHGFTKAFIVTDPVLLETGTLELTLDCSAKLKCFALGIDGERREELPLHIGGGRIRLAIDTAKLRNGPALYFELAER